MAWYFSDLCIYHTTSMMLKYLSSTVIDMSLDIDWPNKIFILEYKFDEEKHAKKTTLTIICVVYKKSFACITPYDTKLLLITIYIKQYKVTLYSKGWLLFPVLTNIFSASQNKNKYCDTRFDIYFLTKCLFRLYLSIFILKCIHIVTLYCKQHEFYPR